MVNNTVTRSVCVYDSLPIEEDWDLNKCVPITLVLARAGEIQGVS